MVKDTKQIQEQILRSGDDDRKQGQTRKMIAMHDISCLGTCSLTVALPVLSAFGVEALPLPTSLLSTHTGGTFHPTFLELTQEMKRILKNWEEIGLKADGIYTGYFGDEQQIDVALSCIRQMEKPELFVCVDPVMGDNGTLYSGFGEEIIQAMRKLLAKADVITPNMTEAQLLLGRPTGNPTMAEAEEMLVQLQQFGCRQVIITGVETTEDVKNGTLRYFARTEDGCTRQWVYEKRKVMLHGCGDVFASVLSALLLQREPLFAAVSEAADFVEECITETMTHYEAHWYGLQFEPILARRVRKGK